MARTNKYASINFNDIYEKKSNTNNSKPDQLSSSSSSSSSATFSSSSSSHQSSSTYHSNSRIHGRMLVLTRPSPPKPQPQQPPSFPSPHTPKSSPAPAPDPEPDQTRLESDPISLRPLGRTGSSISSPPVTGERERGGAPAPATFVPPHLRPGFVGREERFEGQNGHRNHHQGFVRSPHREFGPGQVGEDGRPKSGGGLERGGVGEVVVDVGEVNRRRPSSSGHRSGNSGLGSNGGGWYGSSSSYRSPPHY